MEIPENAKRAAMIQAGAGLAGAAAGAMTKQASFATRPGMRGQTAAQIGSAMGAAAATGAGVKGTLAAGAAVVTAKAAVIGTAAVAAAPFVVGAAVVGGVGYGLYRLFKKSR